LEVEKFIYSKQLDSLNRNFSEMQAEYSNFRPHNVVMWKKHHLSCEIISNIYDAYSISSSLFCYSRPYL